MSLIKINKLNFSYYGYSKDIFKDVNIEFDTNWKTALIGKNGIGKSTFFKILSGEVDYNGSVSKSTKFLKFPFYIKDKTKTSIEIFDENFQNQEQWEFYKEANLLDIDIESLYLPYSNLSKGEQTKVLLAMVFTNQDSFMLIDEPTNHLDFDSRIKVSEYLKGKKGFLMISHDRKFIDLCVDHIISINNSCIDIQEGNFSSWYENKIKKDKFELSENEKLKKDIKRLKESSVQSKRWSDMVEKTKNATRMSGSKVDKGFIGHKSAKMMKRSKNLEKRQSEAFKKKQELLKDIDKNEDLKLNILPYSKDVLIEVNEASFYFEDNYVTKNVSFKLKNGERLYLKGKNGSGKSTIIKALLGENKNFEGQIKIPEDLKISYIRQDIENMSGSLKKYIKLNKVDESLCKSILIKLGFSREIFDMDIKNYSDGQKKKVNIAISLSKKANVFIWDEPLNYIDLISRIQIENIISSYKPTMIFVEHDLDFANNITTAVIEI